MSAVLSTAADPGHGMAERSEGVWHAAWRRFKSDRVGMISAAIVVAFLVMIALSFSGLIAKNWQAEVGVANAPPGGANLPPLRQGPGWKGRWPVPKRPCRVPSRPWAMPRRR